MAIIIRVKPEGIEKQFKGICQSQFKTMNDVLSDFIRDYVKKPGVKDPCKPDPKSSPSIKGEGFTAQIHSLDDSSKLRELLKGCLACQERLGLAHENWRYQIYDPDKSDEVNLIAQRSLGEGEVMRDEKTNNI